MSIHILQSLHGYKREYLSHDLIAGAVVAALTIPISMGYAYIAGLPPVYGLYGSVLPALGYALFASNPQLIFGVDAAASAITGSVLLTLGIAAGSQEALTFVPALSLFTGLILLLFAVCRAGKVVSYVSMPVMGGFITGVAVSIMATLIPKMLGVTVTSSENFIDNIALIITSIPQTSLLALVVSVVAFLILWLSHRFIPKVPMPLFVLIASVVVTKQAGLDVRGVPVMGDIPSGLPALSFPTFTGDQFFVLIGYSFTIALVVMMESLLASNTFSMRNHYRLDDNQELFAFGIGNLLSAISGTVPTSASVSRTAAADGYGSRTQLSGLVSVALMVAVLFLTPWLYYLPIPVLAVIVFMALTTVLETDLAKRLWKCNRTEFWIFVSAGAGVLLVGILFGVILGVFLSLVTLLIRASNPPRGFLGTIPGQIGYFNMKRFPQATPIPGAIMYRFSASMTFANARVLTDEIEDALTDDTRVVIIDASGIGAFDVTAVERLNGLASLLEERSISFFICEQIPTVSDQMLKLGIKGLIVEPEREMSIEDALSSCGIDPYPGVSAEAYRAIHDRLDSDYHALAETVALGAETPSVEHDESQRIAAGILRGTDSTGRDGRDG